jgi:hypothetical protein
MPDHYSPALESRQVFTKPPRLFCAPSSKSELTGSMAHLPECCRRGGNAACQNRWRNQPLIPVQRRVIGNG